VTTPGTARPGGRTARNAQAVLAATISELSDHAYDEISIEKIAARAGVHKTTIYRRWGSKAELITHALTTVASSMMKIPDTGSIESDLRIFCRSVRATISSPRGAATTRALLAGAAASAEIRGVMQQFWAARQSAIAVIVDRAVSRGELPASTDPAPVMHAMGAPLYYRLLVTGEPLTEQHADQAAAAALAAARAGVFRPAALDPASPPR
jgi:AcrR family transcriptional regulator